MAINLSSFLSFFLSKSTIFTPLDIFYVNHAKSIGFMSYLHIQRSIHVDLITSPNVVYLNVYLYFLFIVEPYFTKECNRKQSEPFCDNLPLFFQNNHS